MDGQSILESGPPESRRSPVTEQGHEGEFAAHSRVSGRHLEAWVKSVLLQVILWSKPYVKDAIEPLQIGAEIGRLIVTRP